MCVEAPRLPFPSIIGGDPARKCNQLRTLSGLWFSRRDGEEPVLQTMFGPYRIEELLGRGGMGEVYRAHDTQTDRTVALKLLPAHLAEDDEYQARFRRECKVAARLSDPHVVPIHRFGDIDGRLYLDMRLVKGFDLGAWLRRYGPMTPEVAVAVIGQVAAALDAAHADDLVHRDVKPSNVLLAGVDGPDVDAASVFAYLFDFGIARARAGAPAPDEISLTMAGVMPGSPSYVAPERFQGVEGDPRADVYSLACVLHQALTGRPPFEGDLASLMRAHLTTPPPRPSIARPGVPAALDDVVATGMAKDPGTRYSTAGELGAAARTALVTARSRDADGAITVRGEGPVRLGGHPLAPPRPAPAVDRPRPTPPAGRPAPRPSQQRSTRPVTATSGAPPARPNPAPAPPARAWTPPAPAPPAAGAHPGRDSASWVVWVALVVFAAVVVGGGFVLASRSGAGTTTTTAAPTTPTSTRTAPPTNRQPDTPDGRLLAGLPAGFGPVNCSADGRRRDAIGAQSYVACEAGPADGPATAEFARFGTREGLDREFSRAVQAANITAANGQTIEVCAQGATNVGTWRTNEAIDRSGRPIVLGRAACVVSAGRAFILWTDEATLSYGYVARGDANAAVLYEWWRKANFGSG